MLELTRRDLLKLSGTALGGLALGSALNGCGSDNSASPDTSPTEKNSLLAGLPPYYPGTETLADNEMRISFMGTTCIPMVSQAAVSVFVELGNGDCFAFDLGTGSIIKYWAMGINLDKLYRIFLAHLHADHMGDLSFVYGFGPSYGRSWPLYIWGPSDSGFVYTDANNKTRGPFKDGTKAYCDALRQMMIWHNESQSFLTTSYQDYVIPAYDPDPSQNRIGAYDLVPTELDWRKTGMNADGNLTGDNVAYNHKDVKITHFPAVHCRSASLSYKLEWNGLSMIYAGDTLPNQYMINHARTGVDVLVHEMVMPASNWGGENGDRSGDPSRGRGRRTAGTGQLAHPTEGIRIYSRTDETDRQSAAPRGRHPFPGHGRYDPIGNERHPQMVSGECDDSLGYHGAERHQGQDNPAASRDLRTRLAENQHLGTLQNSECSSLLENRPDHGETHRQSDCAA